jgi:CheY-like chemotaxis protein
MRTIESSTEQVLGGRGVSPSREATPRRVLVVDDENDIRDTLADVLTAEGYSVQTAANGLEALDVVQRRPIDVVLVDLMMPIMDGWTFFSRVRRDPKTADLPIVAVSAMPPEAGEGFTARLRKPFDLEKLLETMSDVCPVP